MNPEDVQTIIGVPVPLPQSFAGEITFTRRSGAVVQLRGGVDVNQDIVGNVSSDAQILDPGTEHCDVAGEQWQAPESFVTSTGHSMSWNEAEHRYEHAYSYRFYSPEIIISVSDANPSFTRESFLGLEIEAPYKIYDVGEDRRMVEHWIPVDVFGREAALYRSKTRDGKPALSVIYHGGTLQGDERAALLWLIRYLAGASDAVTVTESFDQAQARTVVRVQPHVAGTRQSLPPLLYNRIPGYADESLRGVFGSLLIRVRDLLGKRKIRRRLSGILLAYLDAADTHYANTRGRCAIIAIDALISLVMPQNKLIQDKGITDELKQKLEDVVDEVVPEALRQLVKNNLNINSESVNARRRRFFEYLGIDYTTQIQRLIRDLRNPAVHDATFGEDDITVEGLRKNIKTAEQAIDLFNRAMLSFLGYDGEVYMHENVGDGILRERPIRDRLPDVEIDRLTSRAAGLTQFMRPEITMELTQGELGPH